MFLLALVKMLTNNFDKMDQYQHAHDYAYEYNPLGFTLASHTHINAAAPLNRKSKYPYHKKLEECARLRDEGWLSYALPGLDSTLPKTNDRIFPL